MLTCSSWTQSYHMNTWKLLWHVTVSILIIKMTSLHAHSYFWIFFVNKWTPHPAFINSSWWCIWSICCYTTHLPVGGHFQKVYANKAPLPWMYQKLPLDQTDSHHLLPPLPYCRKYYSSKAIDTSRTNFMMTFKATMSPFHLSLLCRNESFH